ncbi:MAG: sulfotransferase [Bacteroidota bacterium]
MDKTLIYILGAGRSGTTLLDIILGNSEDVISLGEVNRFFKRRGIPPKRKEGEETYVFWEKVKEGIEKKEKIDYEKAKTISHFHEYHSNILKAFFGKYKKSYKTLLTKQYEAIFENTTQHVLIESSKYPARALNISRILGEEVIIKYIYLKKDPVKVVRAFNKKNIEQPRKGFLASNMYYFVVNLFCSLTVLILKKRKHRVACIRYEELVGRPLHALEAISNKLDENFEGSKGKISENMPLSTGFLFDGNRIRLQKELFLRRESSSKPYTLGDYFSRIFNYLIYH